MIDGFAKSIVDQCIYMKVIGSKFIILVLYVDGILLVVNDFGLLHDVEKILSNNFEMKDMNEAFHVIGIKIFHDRSEGLLQLSQSSYINKMIDKFKMNKCPTCIFPI